MQAVEPYYLKFHWSDGYAPFLVTHEGVKGDTGPDGDELPDDEAEALRSGWVLVADVSNDAGLQDGLNRRDKIGHGGPGIPGSWSSYGEH
jgi:hypothetical protein